MNRSLLLFAVAGALTGCGTEPTSAFSGTVTARSFPTGGTAQVGSILVTSGPSCEQQIAFQIASTTRLILRDGTSIPADSLAIGRVVSVTYGGIGIMTCPPSFTATLVVVESSN